MSEIINQLKQTYNLWKQTKNHKVVPFSLKDTRKIEKPLHKNKLRTKSNILQHEKERKYSWPDLNITFIKSKILTPMRIDIFEKNIKKQGGNISINAKTTHIVSHSIDYIKKHPSYNTWCSEKSKFVSIDWITDSLKIGQPIKEDPYEFHISPLLKKCFRPEFYKDKNNYVPLFEVLMKEANHVPFSIDNIVPKLKCQKMLYQTETHPDKECKKQLIVEHLQKLSSLESTAGEQWRSKAYKQALNAIVNYPNSIYRAEQVQNIRGIGKKIFRKIEEIIETGTLKKVELMSNNPRLKTLKLFQDIWGVGPTIAKKWFEKGYRTLDDVKRSEKLSRHQRVGMKHYDDFKQRIPREEITRVKEYIYNIIRSTYPPSLVDNLKMEVCGSYRRGSSNSGDIDILFADKNDLFNLQHLVKELSNRNFLTDHLTESYNFGAEKQETLKTPEPDLESSYYMGVYKLDDVNIHRRIDLRHCPYSQWSFSLLYFTGSDLFNRSMRYLAQKKGYSLSDKSLRLVVRRSPSATALGLDNKLMYGHCVKNLNTEKAIFTKLGLEYVIPEKRNVEGSTLPYEIK